VATEKKTHGRAWRVLAHRDGDHVALENEGVFDELVVDDWLHIEQMDDNIWWLRLGDARILVTLQTDGPPTLDVERGVYAPPKGMTTARE
jgi:hypothetical protein